MTKSSIQISVSARRKKLPAARGIIAITFCVVAALFFIKSGSAQIVPAPVTAQQGGPFRIGERIAYNVSFGKFNNVAYAEMHVVSRGKLGDKDAVELRSRIKTLDFLSAAFYALDESRTVFAAADTGMPLYVTKTLNNRVTPTQEIDNYLTNPASGYDLLTMIYKAREAGGAGSFPLLENDKAYTVTLAPGASEKVKTDAGEFETTVSTVQCEYLTENGITNLRINFSSDEQRIPAMIRFKTAKGEFRAVVSSIQILQTEPATDPTPTPVQTPRPAATPKPIPTPAPYLENEPLAPELLFAIGETLEYKITSGGQPVGSVTLQAKERKQFFGEDSLLLTGTVTSVEPENGLFALQDSIRVYVNPETLAPMQLDAKFGAALSSMNQSVLFDQRGGSVVLNSTNRIEIPIGTHSILSLLYAARSFNLKPSKNLTNPVNDTRVAVFWQTKPHIFTLRPSTSEIITLLGEKVPAQLISINTGNPQLDQMNIKLWLSTAENRVPLRISVGSYQADLVSQTVVLPK